MQRDPYAVLGLEPGASRSEAKAAYRRLAEIFHPDRFADARDDVRTEAEKQMKLLNLAWSAVSAGTPTGPEASASGPSGRARQGESWAESRREKQARSAGEPDFSRRARHASTRERAHARRDDGAAARARRADDTDSGGVDRREREAFVREARRRLEDEDRS